MESPAAATAAHLSPALSSLRHSLETKHEIMLYRLVDTPKIIRSKTNLRKYRRILSSPLSFQYEVRLKRVQNCLATAGVAGRKVNQGQENISRNRVLLSRCLEAVISSPFLALGPPTRICIVNSLLWRHHHHFGSATDGEIARKKDK